MGSVHFNGLKDWVLYADEAGHSIRALVEDGREKRWEFLFVGFC